jgi:hypothetical protein
MPGAPCARLVSLDRDQFLTQLYGGLLYLRVCRFQVEKDLDNEALFIFALEVTTTPTIQLVRHCPNACSTPQIKSLFGGRLLRVQILAMRQGPATV